MSAGEPGPILVTGAAGKTGLAILRRLQAARESGSATLPVRALARNAEQREALASAGVADVREGDLLDPHSLAAAVEGASTIYHICPNVHPQEIEIGTELVGLATAAGIERFVFHSVLHPQTRAMPHHWAKLGVEERLFESGLETTILQPAPYMQNVLAQWSVIVGSGRYEVPYAPATRVAMVDLEDVAEAAARVLTEEGHAGATYELAGEDLLDQTEIAAELARGLGREVVARALPRSEWAAAARAAGMPDQQVETLLAMFRYYERYGMTGNPNVLSALLERPATTFRAFVERVSESTESAR